MDEWWTITEKSFNFVIKLRWSMGGTNWKGRANFVFWFFFFCIYICFMEMRIVQEGCKLQSRFCFCIFVFGILSTLFSFTPTPSAHIPHPYTLLQFLTAKQAATVGYLTPCFHMGLPSSMEAGREYFMRNEEKHCINGRHSCFASYEFMCWGDNRE